MVYRHAHRQISQIDWLKVESRIDDLNWILFWESVAKALLKEKLATAEILRELIAARDGNPSERVKKLCTKPIKIREVTPAIPKKRWLPLEPLYLDDDQIEELIRKKDIVKLAYHYKRLRRRVR